MIVPLVRCDPDAVSPGQLSMLCRSVTRPIGSDVGPCDRIQPPAPQRGATLTEARQDRGRLYTRTIRGCWREGFQDQDRTLQAPSNDRRIELLTAGVLRQTLFVSGIRPLTTGIRL